MGFIAAIAAVKATADAIKSVKGTLEELDDERSVVIIVANYTDYTFVLDDDGTKHDHGGWAVNPTREIPPNSVDIYGSRDKGVWTGTEGTVAYRVRGTEDRVNIKWDNPYIGSNTCGSAAYQLVDAPPYIRPWLKKVPVAATKVRVEHSCGVGNEKAEMRYEVRPLVKRAGPDE